MATKGKLKTKKRAPKVPKITSKDKSSIGKTNPKDNDSEDKSKEKKKEPKELLQEYVLRPPALSETKYQIDVFVTAEPESEIETEKDTTTSDSSTSTSTSSTNSTNSTNSTTNTSTTNSNSTSSSDTSTSTSSADSSTSTSSSSDSEDTESDDEGFSLHTGDILETHTYKQMYSIDYDHDYTDSTGSGKLTFQYVKDHLNFFYKGVRLIVKEYWKYPETFQKLEDKRIALKQKEIDEEKKELAKIKARIKKEKKEAEKSTTTDSTDKNSTTKSTSSTNGTDKSSTTSTKTDTTSTKTTTSSKSSTKKDEDNEIGENPVTPYDASLAFITDSQISQDGLEISLSDYGKMLEAKKELSYTQKKRSEIYEEVITEAGFTPVVDFTGLQDDIIDWTSVSTSGSDSSSSSANADGSMTESQVWEIAQSMSYAHRGSNHCPSKGFALFKKGGSGDCYDVTAALYFAFNYKVGIPARDTCGHGTGTSGSHHWIQLYKNGSWIDPPEYSGMTGNLRIITSRDKSKDHVCRAPGGSSTSFPAYSNCPFSNNDNGSSC